MFDVVLVDVVVVNIGSVTAEILLLLSLRWMVGGGVQSHLHVKPNFELS